MIKDSGDEIDDYSISPKVRQILLQLKKKICCNFFSLRFLQFFYSIKMSYYQFNKQEILQKAKKTTKKTKTKTKTNKLF